MTTSRVRKGVLAVGIIALLFFYFPPQVLRYYLVLASHYISTPVDVEALMSAARESLTPVSSLASVAPAWKAVFNLVLGMVFIGLPILYFCSGVNVKRRFNISIKAGLRACTHVAKS